MHELKVEEKAAKEIKRELKTEFKETKEIVHILKLIIKALQHDGITADNKPVISRSLEGILKAEHEIEGDGVG